MCLSCHSIEKLDPFSFSLLLNISAAAAVLQNHAREMIETLASMLAGDAH